jgi:antitoxin PrlF
MSLGMKRPTRPLSFFSKVSVNGRTEIPREVRERLQLKPGDTLRYRLTGASAFLDKAQASDAADPFAAFSEWSGEADEKAYGKLKGQAYAWRSKPEGRAR